jgi:hypothetical protein
MPVLLSVVSEPEEVADPLYGCGKIGLRRLSFTFSETGMRNARSSIAISFRRLLVLGWSTGFAGVRLSRDRIGRWRAPLVFPPFNVQFVVVWHVGLRKWNSPLSKRESMRRPHNSTFRHNAKGVKGTFS